MILVMCAQSLTHVWHFMSPWTVAHQALLSGPQLLERITESVNSCRWWFQVGPGRCEVEYISQDVTKKCWGGTYQEEGTAGVQAGRKEGLGICLEAKKCSRSVKGLTEDEAQQVWGRALEPWEQQEKTCFTWRKVECGGKGDGYTSKISELVRCA